jgi:hypothetical protein
VSTAVLAPDAGLRALLLRLFLVLPPAQVLGVLLAGGLLGVSGLLPGPPGLTALVPVVAGLVGGAAVGLLVEPAGAGLRRALAAQAVLGSASVLLLTVLAALALPASAAPPVLGSALGALALVVVQTATAGTLWRLRSQPG